MYRLVWILGWAWLISPLWTQPLSDGVFVLTDLMTRWHTGAVSDALSPSVVRTIQSGGVVRQGALLHPTRRPARAVFTLELPRVDAGDRLVLTAWAGVDDNARRDDPQNPHDGVRVSLKVEDKSLVSVECREPGWQPLSADLTPFGGRTVKVAFEVDGLGNTNYDWAYIADARILRLRERFATPARSPLPPEGVLEVRGTPGDRFELDAPQQKPIRATIPDSGVLWIAYAFHGARHATLTELQRESMARVYRLQPRLRFAGVYARRALYAPNETAEGVAVIENAGQGTWEGRLLVRVQALQEARFLDDAQLAEVLLPPGARHAVRFRVGLGAQPRLSVMLRSAAGNDGVIFSPTVSALPSGIPDEGSFVRQFGMAWVLQNEFLRLVLTPAFPKGYAARLYGKHAGGWTLLATTPTLAEAVLNAENAPPKPAVFLPESITPNGSRLSLVLQGTVGLVGRATLGYRLEGSRLECTARLTSTLDAHLYRFRFPDWRVGDGSFGERKDEALFPGLEYLLDEEPSSDTRFAAPPYHLRLSPHPYKVTVPVMAVRWRNWLVSMTWNPEAGWSGVLRVPNPMFASPNHFEWGAHHRFALWVPAIPKWADENAEQAREPFRLLKNDSVLLSATLVVRNDAEDVIQAIADYLRETGMPQPPAPQRTDLQALTLTVQGLLGNYDANLKAWRHTNTGPTFYDPQVALPLWVLGHRLYPEDSRRRAALQQVREAVSAQPRGNIGLELAFYIGGLPSVLQQWDGTMESVRKTQRADGSWGWNPETPRHAIFGKAGDTASGWTGQHAARIGQHARITLNPASRESLMRALNFLMRQRRPEGAQTWELPLHVPDLLAVPYAINAFLDAYQLTGESRYREWAERWALRGVPFVYLWSAPDRPIMRGATIPVFGVTWLSQQPWFGVAVQWNGLVYARALYRLAEQNPESPFDWRRLADTITLNAVQQQEWTSERYPAHEGMYPDAFSIVKGAEEYHWDLNPRLVAPCLAQRLRFAIEPKTVIARRGARLVACTAPGLQSAEWEGERMVMEISTPVSGLPALHMYVAGLESVNAVRLNGQPLPQVNDIDKYLWELGEPASGWQRPHGGLIIRVVNPPDRFTLEVE
jgi:hypothetical protein